MVRSLPKCLRTHTSQMHGNRVTLKLKHNCLCNKLHLNSSPPGEIICCLWIKWAVICGNALVKRARSWSGFNLTSASPWHVRELKGYTHITLVFGSCLLYIIYEHIIGRAERMTFIAVVYRKGATCSILLSPLSSLTASKSFRSTPLPPISPNIPQQASQILLYILSVLLLNMFY